VRFDIRAVSPYGEGLIFEVETDFVFTPFLEVVVEEVVAMLKCSGIAVHGAKLLEIDPRWLTTGGNFAAPGASALSYSDIFRGISRARLIGFLRRRELQGKSHLISLVHYLSQRWIVSSFGSISSSV